MTGQASRAVHSSPGEKVRKFLVLHRKMIMQASLTALFCVMIFGLQVYAGGGASDVGSITAGVSSLEKFVKKIVIGIGIIVALFGGITLGLGFAQDNPDGQSRGVKFLVGGVIIASVGAFITMFGGSV